MGLSKHLIHAGWVLLEFQGIGSFLLNVQLFAQISKFLCLKFIEFPCIPSTVSGSAVLLPLSSDATEALVGCLEESAFSFCFFSFSMNFLFQIHWFSLWFSCQLTLQSNHRSCIQNGSTHLRCRKSITDNKMVKEGRCLWQSNQQGTGELLLNSWDLQEARSAHSHRLKWGLTDTWWACVQVLCCSVVLVTFHWCHASWELYDSQLGFSWSGDVSYHLPGPRIPLSHCVRSQMG